ncbi:MAG: AmmeMemoRadiSam system protein B [Vicinamibacteria bacterium]
MAKRLPPLRNDLEVMPSPVPDRPGVLIRDALGFANGILIIPPPLVPALACFDGTSSELDLRAALTRATGEIEVGDLVRNVLGTLADGGFLENAAYLRLRDDKRQAFSAASRREPAHAGQAYPEEAPALREALRGYAAAAGVAATQTAGGQTSEAAPARPPLAIAAPHVSPEGGFRSYAAAFSRLGPELRERTFVVLGTSHHGEPDHFGLTRKPYVTPFGPTRTDPDRVERFARAAGEAALAEDYCHAVEHSIEFQVVYLQHAVAPDVRVVPILVGPFATALLRGGRPEDDPALARAFDALAALREGEGGAPVFVLGIDMAHVGRRYGDRFSARAGEGRMLEVEQRDRGRIERALAPDTEAFWALVQEGRDPLRWCGASALYAFLRAIAPGPGHLLRYEQWNIDPRSVVSFAALEWEA